jgi:Tol biopolymer transport system component
VIGLKNEVIAVFLSFLAVFALLNALPIVSPVRAQLLESRMTDLDEDGLVDLDDLYIVTAAFNSREGDSRFNPAADFDGNGLINIHDLMMVAKDYGKAYYVLTINVSGGTTDPTSGHRYIQGKKINITATPATGWLFNHWSGDITEYQNEYQNPITITMNSDKNITAHIIPPHLRNQQILFVDINRNASIPVNLRRYDLCVMNADGTNKQLLLENAYYISSPAYSPSGKMIAIYYMKKQEDQISLTIFNLTGQILMKTNCSNMMPSFSWAPDGNSVIYGNYFDGIYEFDIETEKKQQILDTNDGTFDHCPAWSPDKSKLAFVHHEFGGNFYVCLINFNRSKIPYQGEDRYNNHLNPEIHLLVNGSSSHDYGFDLQWTPDGKKIIFQLMSANTTGMIYIADVVNHSIVIIRSPLLSTYPGAVQLSPDGKKIAVTSGESLYLLDINGTDLQKIIETDNFPTCNPTWSPDGRYLAFMSNKDLHIVSQDGLVQYEFPNTVGLLTFSSIDWSHYQTTD